MKHSIVMIGMVVLALCSCKRDKVDFGLIDNLRLSPDLEIPLINAKLNLGDVIAGDSNFVVDPDNAVRLHYENDSIFGFSAIDFVNIPDQNPQTLPLVTDGPNLDFTVALGTIGGVELYSARFYKGAFLVQLDPATPFAQNVDVKITLNTATLGGQPVSKIFTIPAGSTQFSDSMDISNAAFDLTGGGLGVNAIGMKAEILNNSSLPSGQTINYTFQFSHLSLNEARGFFGQRIINIPQGAFDLDISVLKQFSHGFYLNDPNISLVVASSVGASLDLAPDMDAVNSTGDVTSLNATAQEVYAAQKASDFDTSLITFNNTNSDIVDFLAALPTHILYSGSSALNPNGNSDTNFINRNSKINFGIDLDIPLNLRMENMTMTQELKDVKLPGETDSLDAITMIFNTKNGFPFDTKVSVAFLDSVTNDSIDGIELHLLSAPAVNSNGKVIKPVEGHEEVTIDSTTLDALKRSKNLRLRAKLNTSNNGQDNVVIFTDYELDVKIAVRGKINLNL